MTNDGGKVWNNRATLAKYIIVDNQGVGLEGGDAGIKQISRMAPSSFNGGWTRQILHGHI